MPDDVVRNPKRIAKPQVPYEPEYVRKKIDVPEAPASLPKEDVSDVSPETFVSMDGFNGIDADGNEIPFENGHIIDNNDYVNLGYASMPPKQFKKEKQPQQPLEENASSPNVGDYILMVFGKLVASGSMDKIESKVKDIMYGDDPDFTGLEISMDDIIVLKRVAIKVGIFIDR